MTKAAALTQAELEEARRHKAAVQRAYWAKMTPEERRERRMRYALNAARKAAKIQKGE